MATNVPTDLFFIAITDINKSSVLIDKSALRSVNLLLLHRIKLFVSDLVQIVLIAMTLTNSFIVYGHRMEHCYVEPFQQVIYELKFCRTL